MRMMCRSRRVMAGCLVRRRGRSAIPGSCGAPRWRRGSGRRAAGHRRGRPPGGHHRPGRGVPRLAWGGAVAWPGPGRAVHRRSSWYRVRLCWPPDRTELPAAVLARILGIHISVAVAWQRAAAGDWAVHAAEISRRGLRRRIGAVYLTPSIWTGRCRGPRRMGFWRYGGGSSSSRGFSSRRASSANATCTSCRASAAPKQ
jgi:hypothetical protein